MPYIRRNALGQIDSLHRQSSREFRSTFPTSTRTCRPLSVDAAPSSDFGRLDADFVRVIEDVIDTLIMKNVLNITDLPSEAQAKLFARKSFRERITRNSLRLFGNSGFSEVIDDTGFRRSLKTRSSDQRPHTRGSSRCADNRRMSRTPEGARTAVRCSRMPNERTNRSAGIRCWTTWHRTTVTKTTSASFPLRKWILHSAKPHFVMATRSPQVGTGWRWTPTWRTAVDIGAAATRP